MLFYAVNLIVMLLPQSSEANNLCFYYHKQETSRITAAVQLITRPAAFGSTYLGCATKIRGEDET